MDMQGPNSPNLGHWKDILGSKHWQLHILAARLPVEK
jgi:hypothetical protein